MALYPLNYGGYWNYGCYEDVYCQIVITSNRLVKRSTHWISSGPLPGIF